MTNKKDYIIKLFPFTYKYLKQYKINYGFKNIDIMLQWLMLYPDKVRLKHLVEMRERIKLSKKGILVFDKKLGKK